MRCPINAILQQYDLDSCHIIFLSPRHTTRHSRPTYLKICDQVNAVFERRIIYVTTSRLWLGFLSNSNNHAGFFL